jgi:hypothetical protein
VRVGDQKKGTDLKASTEKEEEKIETKDLIVEITETEDQTVEMAETEVETLETEGYQKRTEASI